MDRIQLVNDAQAATIYALDGRQARLWTAMPCIIVSVNSTKLTCVAQPAIQGIVTNDDGIDNYVNLPLLVDVPICFPSAGGFMLTLPMVPGDEVLVVIASRCIDAWWQSGGIGVPMEARMHDLSDGFAIPGPRSLPKAALVAGGISPTNVQLRNDLGTTYIEITPTGMINLVAPGTVNVTTPAEVNLIAGGGVVVGNLTVQGNMSVQGELSGFGGTLDISGNLSVGDAVTVGTTITATDDVIAGTVSLHGHVHSGVTTGGSDTGQPVL
jgi:Phage protein Gp138 N-terminal domain